MSQENLLMMSDEMLQAAISKAEQYKFAEKYTVDWGPRPKGQGRRFGNMIRGSMSGALYGVQEYIDPFYNLGLSAEERDEIGVFTMPEQARYLKARSAGFDHDYAMAYCFDNVGGVSGIRAWQEKMQNEKSNTGS